MSSRKEHHYGTFAFKSAPLWRSDVSISLEHHSGVHCQSKSAIGMLDSVFDCLTVVRKATSLCQFRTTVAQSHAEMNTTVVLWLGDIAPLWCSGDAASLEHHSGACWNILLCDSCREKRHRSFNSLQSVAQSHAEMNTTMALWASNIALLLCSGNVATLEHHSGAYLKTKVQELYSF